MREADATGIGGKGRLHVVLYTHHSLFEPALSLAAALSRSVDVHLLLEVPAGRWQLANFKVARQDLTPGIVEGDAVLAPHYPEKVRNAWRGTTSFHLIVPGRYRARDPRSVWQLARVLRWIRDLQPHAVHIDDVDVAARLAPVLMWRRPPYPLIVGCHDPDPHTGELRWQLKKWVRQLILPRADAVVVHHVAGAEALRSRHPWLCNAVHVVYLGAYTFLRALAVVPQRVTPRERPTVLLFGRLTPTRGSNSSFESRRRWSRPCPA